MPVGERQASRFGPFELDTQCGQLRRDGVGLKLQGQPVQILEILLEHPGQLVTREELRERLWASDRFVDFDHSLNTAIKRLRQALGDEAEKPRYVETLPRRGYRFVGEVRANGSLHRNSGVGLQAGEEVVAKITTTLVDAAISAADSQRHTRRRAIAVSALAFFVMSVFGYWLAHRSLRMKAPLNVPPRIGSIAVLPFENLSGDPAQEYFADGMTDELTTNLGKIGELRVISRTSVMRYKGTQKPLPEIARS